MYQLFSGILLSIQSRHLSNQLHHKSELELNIISFTLLIQSANPNHTYSLPLGNLIKSHFFAINISNAGLFIIHLNPELSLQYLVIHNTAELANINTQDNGNTIGQYFINLHNERTQVAILNILDTHNGSHNISSTAFLISFSQVK
jgi:hypothetical protein